MGSVGQDVGASVKESRELTPKYEELKLQSLFLRSTPDFYKTVLVCQSHFLVCQ
jgi:hypothetical protein